ncbi:hypothetical protein LPB248_11970 [Flavobacterium sp. LPB0248]|uniref:hypothetical protein n=1 Tax=Flavobacterium sp. LPB0248 TaxID=2614441 RepID=UPI0015A66EBF|nr:hypothetical protein [Flavobacterium sp. LPB0248]QLC66987.1 hypothetical protein LPB248_11970 [Flavobacterium sp. LPB0248]
MDTPKINENQFAVGQAEYTTGIILKKNNQYYNSGEDILEVYSIFESLDSAKAFTEEGISKNSNIEFFILNYKSETVYIVDQKGERK